MTRAIVWDATPRMSLSLYRAARQEELYLETSFTAPERRGCGFSKDTFVFHTHSVSMCDSERVGEPGDGIATFVSLLPPPSYKETTTKSPQYGNKYSWCSCF